MQHRGDRICSYLLFIVGESSVLKRHKGKAWIGPNKIICSPIVLHKYECCKGHV